MPDLVRNILLSSRTWLAIGAFCIGAAFVIGYHEDQRSAERVLQERVGLPQTVLIQDFAGDRHTNMIGHTCILGEVHLARTLRVNLGSEEWPRWVDATPVFPVGNEMMPLAVQFLNAATKTQRRPMPRADADYLKRYHRSLNTLEDQAFAFIVRDVADKDDPAMPLSEVDYELLEQDGDQLLVRLHGAVITGRGFQDQLTNSLHKLGIEATSKVLLVAPVSSTSTEIISSEDIAALRRNLTILGVICALFAMVAPRLQAFRGRRPVACSEAQEVSATHAFPAVNFFQPIAAQDELSVEEPSRESRSWQTALGRVLSAVRVLETVRPPRSPQ